MVYVAVLEDGAHGIEVLAASADRGIVARTAAGLLSRSGDGAGPIEQARRSVLKGIAEQNLQPV